MKPDFFTRYAVVSAFVGFGVFLVFGLTAMALFTPPFDWLNEDYSGVGAILDGNLSAGLLSAGLALAGGLWTPVVLVYLREIVDGKKVKIQPYATIGFMMQIVGRVGIFLTGAFPTDPWKGTHDAAAITWLAGELAGVVFIMVEMFRSPSERRWGFSAVLVIAVGTISWLPYFFGAWDGMAIPEFVTVLCFYAYSVGLWIRAFRGHAAIAPPGTGKAGGQRP